MIEALRLAIRQHFFPRRHTALLISIVAAFAVRPLIGDAVIALAVFSIALVVLLLVALYTIQVDELVGERKTLLAQKRRRNAVGWILATLALGERLALYVVPTPRIAVPGMISWLLFICYVIWAELRSVLRQKEVTGETIAMSYRCTS